MTNANSSTQATAPAAKPAKVELTPAQIEAKAVAKASEKLVTKYGKRVVAGSVHRAPEGSAYGKKMLCEINTIGLDGKPDGLTRTIATSDVFQVFHTVEVAAELKKTRQADKRKAAAAKREAAKPVTDAAAALGLDD